jgi:signal transduction histidine kinase
MWRRVSPHGAFLLVTDPEGRVIAAVDTPGAKAWPSRLAVIPAVRRQFPEQASGFWEEGGSIFQIVVTPVFVQSGQGPALLNVLAAGYRLDSGVLHELQASALGSEFILMRVAPPPYVIASTLELGTDPAALPSQDYSNSTRVRIGSRNFAALALPLPDLQDRPLGRLWILRSFSTAEMHLTSLRRDLGFIWAAAALLVLAVAALTVRSIVARVRRLGTAAAEVAQNNYQPRLPADSGDELGELARTFNTMCASLERMRAEVIRQERLSTVSRLTSSLVHDLRNPLAAIYGGAELLVDEELPAEHVRRLAGNIYRSSRQVQQMLQDLLEVSRGKIGSPEQCRLREIVEAAAEAILPLAEAQSVVLANEVPADLELPLERARMERVFLNLFSNALDVMPQGGRVQVRAERSGPQVIVSVEDTGPGIDEAMRARLFHPFESSGKRNGLGLGLALSRQTVLDHGGDLWADSRPGPGACFRLRLRLS